MMSLPQSFSNMLNDVLEQYPNTNIKVYDRAFDTVLLHSIEIEGCAYQRQISLDRFAAIGGYDKIKPRIHAFAKECLKVELARPLNVKR